MEYVSEDHNGIHITNTEKIVTRNKRHIKCTPITAEQYVSKVTAEFVLINLPNNDGNR